MLGVWSTPTLGGALTGLELEMDGPRPLSPCPSCPLGNWQRDPKATLSLVQRIQAGASGPGGGEVMCGRLVGWGQVWPFSAWDGSLGQVK